MIGFTIYIIFLTILTLGFFELVAHRHDNTYAKHWHPRLMSNPF